MDGLGICIFSPSNCILLVSILVSYWMGWECLGRRLQNSRKVCFNPSFLLDGLGIELDFRLHRKLLGFNPSFLLDGLGIMLDAEDAKYVDGFNPSFLLDGLGM